MDTKSSKCVHLVEGGTNGPQYVNMALMGNTSLGHVTHARKRQKTSFTNLETHGDASGYLACDTCSTGVPKEIVPAGIVRIGNILVGNNLGVQTRTKSSTHLPLHATQAATGVDAHAGFTSSPMHIVGTFAHQRATVTMATVYDAMAEQLSVTKDIASTMLGRGSDYFWHYAVV